MIFFISMYAGIYLHALGGGDCGLDRLYPSGITSDTEYSSTYSAANLLDGMSNTFWRSSNGDVYDNVYLEFSNNVDIKHIMVQEGAYYTLTIFIYDDNTGVMKSYQNSDDVENFKVYNFWFSKWVTDKIKIYFASSEGSYLNIMTVSVWGCNATSTLPTAVPTVSPSQMPTNHTPTVMPTNLPSASPTDMPTTLPDDGITDATTPTDGDSFISIEVLVTLIVLIFVLALSVIYLVFKLRRAKGEVRSLNVLAMQETHLQKEQL